MKRRKFLEQSLKIGAGFALLPDFLSLVLGDKSSALAQTKFNGKVIVIGAGAAGLTAGYLLNQAGVDFHILEASNRFGGRIKKVDDFADFPIDLGAEWIHDDPSILFELTDKSVDIDLIEYNPQTIYSLDEYTLKNRSFLRHVYSEYKFKNSTWYDYFEKYIAPSISNRIIYNSPVKEVDYSGSKVRLKNTSNKIFEADKVIVTVPVNILKNNNISFRPKLPSNKIEALKYIDMPDGIKVFIKFSEKFYPDLIFNGLSSLITETNLKTYYDAAFRKDSKDNILGFLSIGDPAPELTSMKTEKDIINRLINDLDKIFNGKASKNYKKHIIQNWTKQPYIRGSYSFFEESEDDIIDEMIKPLNDKVYFAGEALNQEGNTATVHGAAQSSYSVVNMMIES